MRHRNFLQRARNHATALLGVCAAICSTGAALATQPDIGQGNLARVEFLHSFSGPDGADPTAALVFGTDGQIHGVALEGGDRGFGTAFLLRPNGDFTVLHHFNAKHGPRRPTGLIQGADGYYYGVSYTGGEFQDSGTVYRMTTHGDVTVLHSFNHDEAQGANASAPLLQIGDASLYGTTCCGVNKQAGGVFRIEPDGSGFKQIHQFRLGHRHVYQPGSLKLTQADDGNIYGVTQRGGGHDVGAVYRVGPDGGFEIVHSFRPDRRLGYGATTGLLRGADGYLYGMTSAGGAHDEGTFFKMDIAGQFTVLYAFRSDEGSRTDNLILARDGNFYGVLQAGGRHRTGAAYRLSPEGLFTHLYSFPESGASGRGPYSALVEAADGVFYGTTRHGGEYGLGTVYRLKLK